MRAPDLATGSRSCAFWLPENEAAMLSNTTSAGRSAITFALIAVNSGGFRDALIGQRECTIADIRGHQNAG
ncbi:hypothetical protein QU42_02615 [Bradyrhizobium sp. UASWS1016]|nr:hypothetical protein QU42_02615 [Bradyrhizobium sp. UASWS1016]